MPEPHHVTVELDQVVEAARAAGDQWREFLRAGMFSAGVYRLSAGETDHQTPHAEDEIYYVLAGRAELEVEGKRQAVEPGSNRLRNQACRAPFRRRRRGPRAPSDLCAARDGSLGGTASRWGTGLDTLDVAVGTKAVPHARNSRASHGHTAPTLVSEPPRTAASGRARP